MARDLLVPAGFPDQVALRAVAEFIALAVGVDEGGELPFGRVLVRGAAAVGFDARAGPCILPVFVRSGVSSNIPTCGAGSVLTFQHKCWNVNRPRSSCSQFAA